MLITPEIATDWLENHNPDNYRKLDMTLARQYSRDMFSGRWVDTKAPINFDIDGDLQDGQHRLTAIVIAGVSIEIPVNHNMPKEARDYTDLGRKRTLASILTNSGYQNTNLVQSVLRTHIDVQTHRKNGKALGRTATFPEIKEMADTDEHITWCISATNSVPKKIVNRTAVTYCYWQFHKVDPDAAAVFLKKLTDPANLDENHPLLKMHKRFTNGTWYVKGKMLRLQQVTVMIRAWNAWRTQAPNVVLSPLPREEEDLKIPEIASFARDLSWDYKEQK